ESGPLNRCQLCGRLESFVYVIVTCAPAVADSTLGLNVSGSDAGVVMLSCIAPGTGGIGTTGWRGVSVGAIVGMAVVSTVGAIVGSGVGAIKSGQNDCATFGGEISGLSDSPTTTGSWMNASWPETEDML